MSLRATQGPASAACTKQSARLSLGKEAINYNYAFPPGKGRNPGTKDRRKTMGMSFPGGSPHPAVDTAWAVSVQSSLHCHPSQGPNAAGWEYCRDPPSPRDVPSGNQQPRTFLNQSGRTGNPSDFGPSFHCTGQEASFPMQTTRKASHRPPGAVPCPCRPGVTKALNQLSREVMPPLSPSPEPPAVLA